MSYWDNNYKNDGSRHDSDCENDLFDKKDELIKDLDPEILDFFGEDFKIKAGLAKRKVASKRKKVTFTIGQNVVVNGKNCVVLYGPYDQDNKQFYELETQNGQVIKVESKNIEPS